MVMETPSPQCVGLEFVRQYYTVLNKAPMHLHRFYSNNSLFMHGGPNSVNDPTIGQEDIHKKILSLNFQDCHAKIRMVDAHATLGSGVVIQVTGELSNNGMPMRRFMQTFVLAPQSAKKYYVHNDIFRYQDEVFSDEEVGEDASSDPEEELETSSPGIVEGTYTTNSATVNGTSSHHCHTHHREPEPASPVATTPSVTPAPVHNQNPPQVTPPTTSVPTVTPPVQVPVTPVPAVSSVTTNSIPVEPRPPSPPLHEADNWATPASADEWDDAPEEPVIPTPPKKEAAKSPPHPEPSPPTAVSLPVPNEPKTYANLFKNATSSTHPSFHPPPPIQNEQNSIPQQTYHQQPRAEISTNRHSGPVQGSPPSATQPQSGPGSSMRLSRNFHDDERRRPAVPDSQQVFVGNLPHSIGEEQLRTEFSQYGRILEVRINTGKGKTGVKGPGHQVPNFGFIAFDDEEAVQRCLGSKPIYLNGECRINVEEKKARSRVESSGGGGIGGGRPGSGGRGGGMGGTGGGPPGGMRGGQGMMQGGRGGRGSFNRDNNRGGPRGGFMQRR